MKSWRRILILFALFSVNSLPTTSAAELQRLGFDGLHGWVSDDHSGALQTFRLSCREILDEGAAFRRPVEFGGKRGDWIEICQEAYDTHDARQFFESRFTPFRVSDPARPEGLFTGYYEPEVEGSRTEDSDHPVPIYGKPGDLVKFDAIQEDETGLDYGRIINGKPQPYLTRKEIEQGALRGRGLEVAWLRDWGDAFFIHIQGSGRVRLSDGSVMRLSYAAKSGLAYTSIGALLVEQGVFSRDEMSMQTIRNWMHAHSDEGRKLMWRNESFIFFREASLANPDLGALGAQHVQLTPRRSLAIDRGVWMFGMPIWLETAAPTGQQHEEQALRHLFIAQDTGTAIRGYARGDVYWGFGDAAASAAGRMKSPGTMVVLLPNAVARRLGLLQ